jgi:phosphohistidine phosphatase
MPNLILLRHGESAEKQAGETDFERVLTQRGITSIKQLALQLSNEKLIPDYVLTSPAMRTKQTTQIVLDALGLAAEPHAEYAIYNGDDVVYQALLESVVKDHKCVMLVGHNPSISALIGRLTGNSFMGLHPGQAAVLSYENEMNKSRFIKAKGPF